MNTYLTNLIYTRISHDLSNAAGAVYNGTELLAEDPQSVQETLLLLQNGAHILMDRIKFFRQTFGLPNVQSEDVTADYLSTLSMPIKLVGYCLDSLSKACVMTLADCLVKGGVITVKEDEIVAMGEALRVPEELQAIIENGKVAETPNNAPAMYAYTLAREKHIKLLLSCNEEKHLISLKRVVNS